MYICLRLFSGLEGLDISFFRHRNYRLWRAMNYLVIQHATSVKGLSAKWEVLTDYHGGDKEE